MRATKRTVILRSLLAFVFLLLALAPYLLVIRGIQDAAFVGVIVTPLFLIASEVAGIRAITTGSHITDRRKHRILVWSLAFYLSALAAGIMLFGSYFVASSPFCTSAATSDICMQSLGLPTYVCIGAFAAVSILALIEAPVTAIADAARTHKWLWFLAMLVYLLGSLAALVSLFIPFHPSVSAMLHVFSHPDWLLVARAAVPLVMPLITLLYSLTGKEKPVSMQETAPVASVKVGS